ncbi:MAG TPA: hypothetical protein PLQ13_07730 [Candidatus Krumholzibacteria bacterium]|nr:hypothetical protein [Candidatus Krumholzibacteria bacterium]
MKTQFGLTGAFCVTLLALAVALTSPALAGTPSDNGDRLQTRDQLRDQLQDCALDVPDLDRLQIRDRDRLRDGSCQTLLSFAPPIEEHGGPFRHRVHERAQNTWMFFPGLMFAPIWPGTF